MTHLRKIIFVFGFLLIFLTSVHKPAQALDGFVKVTSPSGGEVFTEGQTATITWDSSSNIDTVSIMYKSDEHHGNWVAFSTPNTKSFSWNVDVGNTTNTQFYIEITGYQTGQGSTTAFGGYFTVNQKPDAPTQPPSNNSPTPTSNSTNPGSYTPPSSPNSPIITPKPTPFPTPTPKPLSIYSLKWASMFWFEGSLTTDLSKISDPKHVDNFTIDTKYGWAMSYEETLDLTNIDRLKALRDIQKYWLVESWSIWIKTEWWIVYKEPAIITFKNENLTGFAPNIKVSESNQKNPTDIVKVESAKSGEVKTKVLDSAKLTINPKVEFTQNKYESTKDSFYLPIKTSHTNLKYFLTINGQERLSNFSAVDKNNGSFTAEINRLSSGDNLVQIYYQDGDKARVLTDETTIVFVPLWKRLFLPTLASLLLLLGLGAHLLSRSKGTKHPKTKVKITTKQTKKRKA